MQYVHQMGNDETDVNHRLFACVLQSGLCQLPRTLVPLAVFWD